MYQNGSTYEILHKLKLYYITEGCVASMQG